MSSFRSKPVGWQRDSYRHYLAAKYGSAGRYHAMKTFDEEQRELMQSHKEMEAAKEARLHPRLRTERFLTVDGRVFRTDIGADGKRRVYDPGNFMNSFTRGDERKVDQMIAEQRASIAQIEDEFRKEGLGKGFYNEPTPEQKAEGAVNVVGSGYFTELHEKRIGELEKLKKAIDMLPDDKQNYMAGKDVKIGDEVVSNGMGFVGNFIGETPKGEEIDIGEGRRVFTKEGVHKKYMALKEGQKVTFDNSEFTVLQVEGDTAQIERNGYKMWVPTRSIESMPSYMARKETQFMRIGGQDYLDLGNGELVNVKNVRDRMTNRTEDAEEMQEIYRMQESAGIIDPFVGDVLRGTTYAPMPVYAARKGAMQCYAKRKSSQK